MIQIKNFNLPSIVSGIGAEEARTIATIENRMTIFIIMDVPLAFFGRLKSKCSDFLIDLDI